MKYVLTLLLALSALFVSAQKTTSTTMTNSSTTSVTESATDNGYTFSVRVDKDQVAQLVELFRAITNTDTSEALTGKFEQLTYGHALVELDTKKRTLSVKSNDEKTKSIASAREIGERIRRELGLKESPTPPTTPKQ